MVAANDSNINEPMVEQANDGNHEIPMDENDDEPELTKEQKSAAIPTLMNEGHRAFLVDDFELATEKFSMAAEYSVAVYESEFAPECFEPHYQYGRALSNLASLESENPQVEFDSIRDYVSKMAAERAEKVCEKQPNMNDSRVGNPDDVTGEERDEVIAAVDSALEENAQELGQLSEKSEETKEEVSEKEDTQVSTLPSENEAADKVEGEQEDITENPDSPEGEIEAADETQDDVEMPDEESEEDDEEDAPATTLAWEALEIARTICEKQGESKEWDMKKTKVLSVLGELSIIESNFENAIKDLEAALKINQKHLEPTDRIIASSFLELGSAHRHNDDYLRAGECFESAKNILVACLEKSKASEDTKGINELEEFIKEVDSCIQDAQSSDRDSKLKKAMEAKEVKQVSPEKAKSDDENQAPVHDITLNIRKGNKRPAEDASEDPKKPKVEEPIPADGAETTEVAAEPVV